MAAMAPASDKRGERHREHPPPDGKVRQSQVITTYGPGAMIDLLNHAVLVSGLEFWGRKGRIAFNEPRLRAYLQERGFPHLRGDAPFVLPPGGDDREPSRACGIQALEFPRWFVCQSPRCRKLDKPGGPGATTHAGRYLHVDCVDKQSYFVPVRFVMACARGHLEDLPWDRFVHMLDGPECSAFDLALLEGPTGDFAELVVACRSCGRRRPLSNATNEQGNPRCSGAQPWLRRQDPAGCDRNLRLLVRTASNAYFSRVASSLDIPQPRQARDAVAPLLGFLSGADSPGAVAMLRRLAPNVAAALKDFSDEVVYDAIRAEVEKRPRPTERLRVAEFKQFLSQPIEQPGELAASGDEFFARALSPPAPRLVGVDRIVLAHKLREVRVQTGFTRFDVGTPSAQGELPEGDLAVEQAPLAARITWLPGVEIRGEGVFIKLDEKAVQAWEDRPQVQARVDELVKGFETWRRRLGLSADKAKALPFFGGRYYLLHTLSHLLIQAVSLECGYSASAIRERIYCTPRNDDTPMAALLLSTGTPGAEGTLGGLLEQGRKIEQHLRWAHDLSVLCSNDPVCAAHDPARDPTERNLEGAACHGCVFIAESSCEQFNHFLDRALVFPTLGHEEAAFFQNRP